MKLETFRDLDYNGRLRALADAVCVGGRDLHDQKILLFQLGSFYIEIFFDSVFLFIREIRAFDSMDLLDPYLENVPLPV